MSRQDLSRVIALTDEGKSYSVKLPQDIMPIVSSLAPCKNTARNITPSTAQILQTEFIRGAAIIKNIQTGKDTWTNLYAQPNLITDRTHLLTISIETENITTPQALGDLLVANIIGLIIELDRLGCQVRPHPQIDRQQNTWNCYLGLNVPDRILPASIVKLTDDFLDRAIVPNYLTGDSIRDLFGVNLSIGC
jgi:poly(A) polymerase